MAGFPAGTLIGAPRIRVMQIIKKLEPVRQGIYAGCIGLRTAVVKDRVMHV